MAEPMHTLHHLSKPPACAQPGRHYAARGRGDRIRPGWPARPA